MPNYTENYNLKKPLQEEFYNIDDHNGNMDIIDEELKKRASLDENGKVPVSQIPSLSYIPTSQKGKANGVASLDTDGKVPASQLPESAGGGSGKRTARFTIGSSQYGWTASDCDYLCDGTADDVEINAAIQALRSTGGEIVLLDGLYNLASAILVNKEGVTLSGNGTNTKIIRAFNDDENDEALQGLIIVTSAYCTIKNLYIDDVKGNYTAYRAISLDGGANCIIADNTIVNIGGDGIYVNSDNNTIDNNNVSSSGNSGINLNKTNKSIVTNNKVSGSAMYGIFAIRVSDGVINNNVCTDNYNSGISLYWADRTTITGNASNNNDDCGFYITRGSGNIVCGNTFVGNGAYGVTIQLYASNTVVMSNNFKDNTSGDVYDKGENNTIHLPYHEHEEYAKYSQHCWLKTGCAVPSYSLNESNPAAGEIGVVSSALYSSTYTLKMGTEIEYVTTADGTPSINIINPRTFTWSFSSSGIDMTNQRLTDSKGEITTFAGLLNLLNNAPAYPYYLTGDLITSTDVGVKISGANCFTINNSGTAMSVTNNLSYAHKLTVEVTYDESTIGYSEILYSASANAYTEGKDGNGYQYSYLGVPSEFLPRYAQTESGSYKGTGTYGANNPNSLTFIGKPKLVFINDKKYYMDMIGSSYHLLGDLYMKFYGTTLWWYSTPHAGLYNSSTQLNDSSNRYYWIAIY